MTQEDKELLLKDLCARLPYDVMVNVEGYDTEKLIGIENETITTKATPTSYSDKGEYPIDIVRPYLRPMSSMTMEDLQNLSNEIGLGVAFDDEKYELWLRGHTTILDNSLAIDWLLKNHFDFIGLISKGLAIEVTENNNPYKE